MLKMRFSTILKMPKMCLTTQSMHRHGGQVCIIPFLMKWCVEYEQRTEPQIHQLIILKVGIKC